MEIIRIAGYTEDEKVEIARRHLIPAALKKHGLAPVECEIEQSALVSMIRSYTREAGVRNLEREISNVARKAVKQIVTGKTLAVKVTGENVGDFLGVPRYRHGEAEAEDQVGVVTGLAWTEVGGELLTIEGVMMPGKGRMTVTGNLKEVMKESISAAASYVRSRAVDFGIEPPLFDRRDIHVHVPEGATPKDGPSAGVAMATAIVSTLTGIPVRRDVAMTGEITLRGRVLPDRRLEGEAAGGAARRHEEGSDPGGERQGFGGDSGRGEEQSRDRPGLAHGRGAETRAPASAGADRVGRGREADQGGLSRPRTRRRVSSPTKHAAIFRVQPGSGISGPGFSMLDRRAGLGAVSSVGRASALHAECRRFEPVTAHQFSGRDRTSAPGYFPLILRCIRRLRWPRETIILLRLRQRRPHRTKAQGRIMTGRTGKSFFVDFRGSESVSRCLRGRSRSFGAGCAARGGACRRYDVCAHIGR